MSVNPVNINGLPPHAVQAGQPQQAELQAGPPVVSSPAASKPGLVALNGAMLPTGMLFPNGISVQVSNQAGAAPLTTAAMPATSVPLASAQPGMPLPAGIAPAATAGPGNSAPLLPLDALGPVARGAVFFNPLKRLFHNNEAVIYALNIRTFGAQDINGDGEISPELRENGTFLSSIRRLDELKALGVNAIHLLPITPVGQSLRLGEAGSLYAPADYTSINPEFDTPGNPTDVVQEARAFVEEAHKRGIYVMIDIPSCASMDLVNSRPDLIAKNPDGSFKTPGNWVDIRMLENGPALQAYYDEFFDLMVNELNVDGFRADVARARPIEFWKHFIDKYPDKAWLAESYVQEDSSPMEHIPRDIPWELLKHFDAIYGQFHIFPGMQDAMAYLDYLQEGGEKLREASQTGNGMPKSFIGSFLTHDDHSLMSKGGPTMNMLAAGLMATQPYTNPYILDGFTTGYEGLFDIFNWSLPPTERGKHPEIGLFLRRMLDIRKAYGDVLTTGSFTPIDVEQDRDSIIAFTRHANGHTLLVVANKDVNSEQTGELVLPAGVHLPTQLVDLAPPYGQPSDIVPVHTTDKDLMRLRLGPGRFHLFELSG